MKIMKITIYNENYRKLLVLLTVLLMSERSMDTVIAPIVTNSHVARTPI